MENNKKGFILPLLLIVITLLVIGVGVYVYDNNKVKGPVVEQQPKLGAPNTSTSLNKLGCSLLPYTGVAPLSQATFYNIGSEDWRGGMVCKFTINPALPIFIFHFIGQPDNTFGNIEITEGNSTKIIQTIKNTTNPDAVSSLSKDILVPVDANFDGYLDAPILTDCGATGNCNYNFYLYNPATNQFVLNSFLTDLGTFKLDNIKKQITASFNSSYADWGADTYQYQNKEYILVQKVVSSSSLDLNQNVITVKTYELKNGKMELTSSITTPSN
jgi:hypothetical protein